MSNKKHERKLYLSDEQVVEFDKLMREFLIEQIDLEKCKKNGYLTVSELREILPLLNQDSLVMIQRIEDKYYENHNWKTLKKFDSEYTPAWCCVGSSDNNLYLDLPTSHSYDNTGSFFLFICPSISSNNFLFI